MLSIASIAAPVAGPGATRIRCRSPLLSHDALARVLQRAPAGGWLAAQTAALWPHGRWAWQRMNDGSDDPLGAMALLTVAWMLWRMAGRLLSEPRAGWLVANAVLTVLATLSLWWLPPLASALLAMLALAAGIAAWLPADAPRAPLAGLLVLALPLVSSLQFYAGYPLRLLTAQLSTWVLQGGGVEVQRVGAAMTVRGQLVLVDAPCSGVQMVWMAYFCACALAAWWGLRDGAFLRRLPLVGTLVLAGNVLRNTLLVSLESSAHGLQPWAHEAIGLAALAAVCAAVAVLMRRGAQR